MIVWKDKQRCPAEGSRNLRKRKLFGQSVHPLSGKAGSFTKEHGRLSDEFVLLRRLSKKFAVSAGSGGGFGHFDQIVSYLWTDFS